MKKEAQITAQHYRITLNDAIVHYNNGDITAKGIVHIYLKIKLKPESGWILRKSAKEICQELGIGKTAFYNAMSRLKTEGAINWSVPENTTFSISLPFRECGMDSAIAESDSAIAESDSAIAESDSAIAESDSAIAESDSAIAESEPSKPSLSKDCRDSPNSYQISNQIPFQFSLSAAERERNLTFFKSLSEQEKRAVTTTGEKWFLPRLPEYPSLPHKWIQSNAIEISQCDFYILELSQLSESSKGNSAEGAT